MGKFLRVWLFGASLTPFLSSFSAADETLTAQQKFAASLAYASLAELHCDLPGESQRAMTFLRGVFGNGFDSRRYKEDADLLLYYSLRIESGLSPAKVHSFCVQYEADKRLAGFN